MGEAKNIYFTCLNEKIICGFSVGIMKSKFHSTRLQRILEKWPGKRLGVYRFLPFFFFMGAGMEFFMINFKMGEANFYTVYKQRQAINKIEAEVASKPS